MIRKFLTTVLCSSLMTFGYGQQKDSELKKMEWFDDAKLGIFIHWGIYSVDGISESWAFFNNYISQDNYLKQLNGFSAKNYQPEEWAKLIKESGAKYTVITSKHHDGISLWDTKGEQALTTKQNALAKRDVLTPFVHAIKKQGLRTGLYYSLPDWSHPYYDIKTRVQKRYDIKTEPKRWNDFIKYYQLQLTELSQQYQPDLLWFDGDWEHTSEEWRAEETLGLLRKYNPNIIINSRLNHHGDYATPEQGIPVKRPESRYWELCYTMNDSWGYQHFDKHYKTPNMIVRTLVDCIAMGGNLLLDIGPKEDGTIPQEQVNILQELGRWTTKHQEAVYGTRAGISSDYMLEKNAFSKDGKTLYVYLDQKKERIKFTGLFTKPKAIRVIGSDRKVSYEYAEPILNIALKDVAFDATVTVIALDFEDNPRFSQSIVKTYPKAESIVKSSDPIESISSIVKWIDFGSNIFKDKINDDGSQIAQSLVFANVEVEQWVKKHAEVLHDAGAGIDANHYNGYSALSADKQTLYLFMDGKPTGPIALKGLKNKIARIRIVGEGSMIGHEIFNKLYWSAIPGIVYIDVPKERLDKHYTVIAVLLDGPIDLYAEEVKAIESNL